MFYSAKLQILTFVKERLILLDTTLERIKMKSRFFGLPPSQMLEEVTKILFSWNFMFTIDTKICMVGCICHFMFCSGGV